ncbi:hypothetical protein [Pseudoflavonifractor phocaeensis]|uniref:hypothetical protein n=1 Tax=Pseudoflavonifractor phocaeensis TaxID=1870988 RepID=UPI00195EA63E|nr:hypothetical protein [Pseudoflavonifractor phocaeensis]MBM6926670.1 hypothetical protein [Pseudoflavonifractor phocaeensis]
MRSIAAGGIHFRRANQIIRVPAGLWPRGTDGAGITRGLAQAGASGVKAAQVILSRLK